MERVIKNMLNEKESKYKEIELNLSTLEKQLYALSIILMQINIEPGVENCWKYNIENVWKDYRYMSSSILYNIKNYINSIKKCINYIDILDIKEINTYIALPYDLSIEIASSIDSVFYSFNKIIEQPFPDELRDVLHKDIIKTYFPLQEIQKSEAGGLYWIFNIFRNRAVHPNKPKYYNDTKEHISYKYVSFNTIPEIISIREDIKLYLNIFDLRKNPFIIQIIQNEIIKGGINKNIVDILFPDNSPKYKKDIHISYPFGKNFKAFDSINDFFSLYYDMSNYIQKINTLFLNNDIINNGKNNLSMKFKYIDNTVFSIFDVFKEDEIWSGKM